MAIKLNYKNITETQLENASPALDLQLIELSLPTAICNLCKSRRPRWAGI